MRALRTAVLGAAAVAVGVTLAPSAQAASADAPAVAAVSPAAGVLTAAAGCREIRVYKPEMRKGQVAATAWGRGCSRTQRIVIELQRKRWYGWQKIAKADFYGPGPKTLYKGCKRGTTFTYRLVGTLIGGGNGWSPTLRAKCP
jgi:hypothetical protein